MFESGSARRLGLIALILNLGALLLVLSVSKRAGVDPSTFYRDPNAVAGQPFVTGFMSNIGAIAWIASASIAIFTSIVRLSWQSSDRDAKTLLLLGLLTCWLGLDDLLMLHDGLAPHVGIPEGAFLLVDVLLGLAWIASAIRTSSFLRRDTLLLASAVIGLGASLVFDQMTGLLHIKLQGQHLMEDVLKLMGITFWALYAVRLSATQILSQGSERVPAVDAPKTVAASSLEVSVPSRSHLLVK